MNDGHFTGMLRLIVQIHDTKLALRFSLEAHSVSACFTVLAFRISCRGGEMSHGRPGRRNSPLWASKWTVRAASGPPLLTSLPDIVRVLLSYPDGSTIIGVVRGR